MKKMNLTRLAGALLLVATLPCAVSMVLDGPRRTSAEAPAEQPKTAPAKAARAASAAAKRPQAPVKGAAAAPAGRRHMVPAEPVSPHAALAARIDRAHENDDLSATLACVRAALTCPDADVRKAMVDALESFGDDAFVELTPFLADTDEEVRTSAAMAWCGVVSQFDDDADKVRSIETVMRVVSDPETLESVADEYLQVSDRQAVESLVRLLEENLPATARTQLLETYEMVTGDEWTSAEAARNWIATECDESV